MSYQFHSWARRSIAAQITSADTLGNSAPPAGAREKIPMEIMIAGQPVSKQFSIAGPGDITGIGREMIVRTDPRPNSGDFEPNYFASIEFYDEDFPWRYTPAAPVGPNKSQLRPWIMLIVLTEDEFLKTSRTAPLSSIVVTSNTALPPQNELYLWAHVHTNFADTSQTDLEKIIEGLRSKSETDPDGIFSRILCPRKLQADMLYHAFLVPVFESGRLAGLDQLPETLPDAQQSAWNTEQEQVELPVYYRWQFRTGANADFETLLRQMEPRKELDPKVGVQELVCTHPGYIKVNGAGEVPAPSPAILNMGGAVKPLSTTFTKLDNPIESQAFEEEVQSHLKLAIREQNMIQDPVVTIPFYGYNHAKTVLHPNPDFSPAHESWLNQINRDPRNRVAAALGTQVVQNKQENFMQSAWLQLPGINEINRKIRHMQLALEINDRMLQSTFARLKNDTGQILAMSRSVSSRMKEQAVAKTVFQSVTESQVPELTLSAAFRRLGRPNGSVAKRLNRSASFSLGRVFTKLNPQANQLFFVLPPQLWLKTLPSIRIDDNLPLKLPAIPSLKSNIGLGSAAIGAINTDMAMFRQNEVISSIVILQPVSTIKLPIDYNLQVLNALKPVVTLLPALRASITGLPKPPQTQEETLPVMAYPDFPEPVYKYLADINQDFIIPNLSLVPPNTIALMEPNYEFIHSFLVGINHEMARELLWREYPTDQRGTYFRQFWDPGGRRSPEGSDQTVYPYKDIKPVTDWGTETDINDFTKIGRPFPNKPLVLLLKGDLFKKYPNTVVFAQKAVKKGLKLVLDDSGDVANLKFPLFTGNLAPDVRLLGFNLTIPVVKGIGNDAGWFFVLAEVPGEPRFGMDINYTPPDPGPQNTWDNLSLENVTAAISFVLKDDIPEPASGKGWPNDSAETQNNDLEQWGRCSADMAGILFQKPSMMAIHGKELLKDF